MIGYGLRGSGGMTTRRRCSVGLPHPEETSFKRISDTRYYHMCSSAEHTLLIEKESNKIYGFGDNRFNQVTNSSSRLVDLSLLWNKLPQATSQLPWKPIVAAGVTSLSTARAVRLRVQRKHLRLGQSHQRKTWN